MSERPMYVRHRDDLPATGQGSCRAEPICPRCFLTIVDRAKLSGLYYVVLPYTCANCGAEL